jgi:L-Ala-D/L-Glu epimerase
LRIDKFATFIASAPYLREDISSRLNRGGVTNVIVKLTADNGLVGWGEPATAPMLRSLRRR